MEHVDAPRLRRALVAALWITVAVPMPGLGQAPLDPAALTLERAVEEALVRNPGLRAAGLAIDVARARGDLGALPVPISVQAEIENFLGSGEVNGFDAAETTLQLSKVLELGGKRELRAGLGSARVTLAETDRSLVRLDLAAEVARRFIRLVALQEEVPIAELAVELAESTLAIVRQGVEVGGRSEAELATAGIALAEAELEREAIETRLEAARLGLGTLWGAENAGNLRGEARLYELPDIQSLETLRSRVADSPELLRTVDEQRLLQAERRLAEARQRSDLELGFGVRHLGAIDDSALVFGASYPLGSRDRSSADVAAFGASLEELDARAEQRRLDVIAALSGLHAEMSNAHERYTRLRDSLLPQSEDAAALYREGFELGSFSLLEFSQAQQSLLDLRRDALAAAARYHTTLVDIEQLLGGTYVSGVSQ